MHRRPGPAVLLAGPGRCAPGQAHRWLRDRGEERSAEPPPDGCGVTIQHPRLLLRTGPASLTWLHSYRNLGVQVARWLEALQEDGFEVHDRLGCQHDNADAPSQHPGAAT